MFLAVAATEMEIRPFREFLKGEETTVDTLVCGVGPVETAVKMGRFLAENDSAVDGILLFGVGGGYFSAQHPGLSLLSVCLAEKEILGDLGVTDKEKILHLPKELTGDLRFELDKTLYKSAGNILDAHNIPYHSGNFVTVNSTSGSATRGANLQKQWQGLCENMEGAAAARVCREYGIPLLEVRVLSNMVEDRDVSGWKLQEASRRAGEIAALLAKELV